MLSFLTGLTLPSPHLGTLDSWLVAARAILPKKYLSHKVFFIPTYLRLPIYMQDTWQLGSTSKDMSPLPHLKLLSRGRDSPPLLTDTRWPGDTGKGDPDTSVAQPVKLFLFWATASPIKRHKETCFGKLHPHSPKIPAGRSNSVTK